MRQLLPILIGLAVGCHTAGSAPPEVVQNESGKASHFPDVLLTAQDGRRLRFHEDLVRDRCVVIQFMYVNCEKICPPTTARLQELHSLLSPEERGRFQFLSISLDSDHDNPETLAAFAARWKAPEGWLYLAGQAEGIAELGRALGERLALPVTPDDPLQHSAVVIVGNDKRGDWRVLPSGTSAERMHAVLAKLLR